MAAGRHRRQGGGKFYPQVCGQPHRRDDRALQR